MIDGENLKMGRGHSFFFLWGWLWIEMPETVDFKSFSPYSQITLQAKHLPGSLSRSYVSEKESMLKSDNGGKILPIVPF